MTSMVKGDIAVTDISFLSHHVFNSHLFGVVKTMDCLLRGFIKHIKIDYKRERENS